MNNNIIPVVPKSNEYCTVVFEDGLKIELPVIEGTFGHKMIDISTLYSKSGMFTFDPGFVCTGSCASKITYIDGDKGKLLHRGYKIEDLAEKCTYLEVCYLLIYGNLPSENELKIFEEKIADEMLIHSKMIKFYDSFKDGAHPMAVMVGVVGALSAFLYEKNLDSDNDQREKVAIKLIAKMPTIAALAYRTAKGLPHILPKKKHSYMKNFLRMMFKINGEKFKIDKNIVDVMEKIFILHADHEQNASTSTIRIAASSKANPWACIAAGITSLWGPAHGGANEAVVNMLEKIGDESNLDTFLQDVKNKKDGVRLMGFGHRVYKNYDPRSKVMKKCLENVLELLGDKDNHFFRLALKIEERCLSDDYFISRKLYPNVDFYTGIIYKAIGIPNNMFTVMFAVSRSVGWISQWMEMVSENNNRISRPRQLYLGSEEREFIAKDKRPDNTQYKKVRKESFKIMKLPNL